jgi:hypothetical protein
MTRALCYGLLFAALSGATACASVPAYERETLASERMQLDADEGEAAMISTRRRTREEGVIGSGGVGASAGGGGCGCN